MSEAISPGEQYANLEKEKSPNEIFTAVCETFISDMNTLWDAGNWDDIMDQAVAMKKQALESCPEEFKDGIKAAYGVIRAVIVQDVINGYRAELKTNKSSEVHEKLAKHSIHAAKWQADCLQMIKQFENFDKGKEFLSAVWTNLEDFSARRFIYRGKDPKIGSVEARGLRNGILSLRLVNDVMEHILSGTDAEVIIPSPEDDVKKKLDMSAVRGNKKIAIQIKSTASGLGNILCERLHRKKPSLNLKGDSLKKVESQNTLYSLVQKREADEALWLEVLGRPSTEIDQITGKPEKEYLDRAYEGELGQNVRAALGIEDAQLPTAA